MSTGIEGAKSTQAVKACLAAIAAHPQDAALALTQTRADAALADAQAVDACSGGRHSAALAGEVFGAKACFDVAGWVSHAGSQVLAGQAPAVGDAPLVERLRAAGAVLLAQNNMTEFAYGALGKNAWYGTPLTPALRDVPRVSGGSSSGSAVAVALGLQSFALGSDTSGSARIPAAFCGVVGFKPTQGRYSSAQLLKLSTSFDVPGLVTQSVAQCQRIDRVLVPEEGSAGKVCLAGVPPVLLVPRHVDAELDDDVRQWFAGMLARLKALGYALRYQELPSWREAPRIARQGGMIAAEAYVAHEALLQTHAQGYDPSVGPRILKGREVLAADYIKAQQALAHQRAGFDAELGNACAVLTPTVPMKPPSVAELADPERYLALNMRSFSLTEQANRLNLPSITLPGGTNSPWLGLMLTGPSGADAALLQLARRVEQALGEQAGRH